MRAGFCLLLKQQVNENLSDPRVFLCVGSRSEISQTGARVSCDLSSAELLPERRAQCEQIYRRKPLRVPGQASALLFWCDAGGRRSPHSQPTRIKHYPSRKLEDVVQETGWAHAQQQRRPASKPDVIEKAFWFFNMKPCLGFNIAALYYVAIIRHLITEVTTCFVGF